LKSYLFTRYWNIEHIRGFTRMRYTNLLTYLLGYRIIVSYIQISILQWRFDSISVFLIDFTIQLSYHHYASGLGGGAVPLPSHSIPRSLNVVDELLGAPATAAPMTAEAAVEAEHRYRNQTRTFLSKNRIGTSDISHYTQIRWTEWTLF